MSMSGMSGLSGMSGTFSARNPAYQILIKTDNAGASASNQFTFPALGSYRIDWGDGAVENLVGSQTHTYPSAGEYLISVTGGLTGVVFNNGGDRLKLLQIRNWGTIAWATFSASYFGCTNLVGTFSDIPILSGVTNMGAAFRDAVNFNSDIGRWNVSTVTNIQTMFFNATAFDQDIGQWNVSSVTSALNFMGSKSDANFDGKNLSAIYNGWSSRPVQAGVTIGFGTIKYGATGVAGRAILTSAPNNWTITDGGLL